MAKYTVSDIDWDVSEEEKTDAAFALNDSKFKETFGIDKSNKNAKDIVISTFRHMPGLVDDVVNLPSTVEIPAEVYEACVEDQDFSAATEYLADKYGYFINGYSPDFQLTGSN